MKPSLKINEVNRSYYLFCRIATVVFATNTIYPVAVKVYQQRLAGDWLHSLLHLMSALFGAYAGWRATSVIPAKAFTWGIGVLYLTLGLYGWFIPGLFLNSALAIPLGVADNIFHILVGAPALIIVMLELLALDA
jgi:hypothetical protein